MNGFGMKDTVKAGGFTMDYFRFGQGEEVLVVLPGLGVQSVMLSSDAVMKAYQSLADDFTIYVFDRRNELPDRYSVCDMANDTAKALLGAGLEQVHLFGASQGGMIAMELAVRYPSLVNKLILGSTSSCITQERYRIFEKWIRLAKAGDAKQLYLSFGEALYPEEIFERSKGLLEIAAKTVTQEDLRRFAILAQGLEGFDITEDLDRIGCPVLLIGSEDDQVLGAEATYQIAEHLKRRPDFELHMYDGYGHAAYDTAPDYRNRMLRFLR